MFDEFGSEEECEDLVEFLQAGARAQKAQMTNFLKASGKTDLEIAIMMFLAEHERDQVHIAQAECLEYLWDGGRIH